MISLMCNIKQKQQTKQTDSQTQTRVWWLPEGVGAGGEDEEGPGGLTHGDRRRRDVGWWGSGGCAGDVPYNCASET